MNRWWFPRHARQPAATPSPAPPAEGLIEHEFVGYQLGPLLICIHLDGTTPCGRRREEHAPAPTGKATRAQGDQSP
jgi:hypothetical protein